MLNFDIKINNNNTYEIIPFVNPAQEADRRLDLLEKIEAVIKRNLSYVATPSVDQVENPLEFLKSKIDALRHPEVVPLTEYQEKVEQTYQRIIGNDIERLHQDCRCFVFAKCTALELVRLAGTNRELRNSVLTYLSMVFRKDVEKLTDLQNLYEANIALRRSVECPIAQLCQFRAYEILALCQIANVDKPWLFQFMSNLPPPRPRNEIENFHFLDTMVRLVDPLNSFKHLLYANLHLLGLDKTLQIQWGVIIAASNFAPIKGAANLILDRLFADSDFINYSEQDLIALLFLACFAGNIEKVKILLRNDSFDLGIRLGDLPEWEAHYYLKAIQQRFEDFTPLAAATKSNNLCVVEFLMQRGAQLDPVALCTSALTNKIEILKLFLKSPAAKKLFNTHLDELDGKTILEAIVERKNEEIIDLCLQCVSKEEAG